MSATPDTIAERTTDTSTSPPDHTDGRFRARRPRRTTVATALLLCATAALLFITAQQWRTRHAAQLDLAETAAVLDAARTGVEAMISITTDKAGDDVQKVLDHSTGAFRTDFQARAQSFVSVVEESKVTTTGNVTALGLEQRQDDSATVLVAAQSTVTNAAGAQNETRAWRLRVTLTDESGTYKMSNVEFVA